MGMSALWGFSTAEAGPRVFAGYHLQPHELAWWQTLLTAFVFLLIWSFFGAAMLRTAAMKLARDEPLSLREAVRFGGKNGPSFLLAPVLVLLFAGFFVFCNASILVVVLFPLVLISSLLIVLALLGGLVGLPLMWAGIAIEQNGPLEALSRAFSYIFARPFRFFFGYFLVFVVMSVVVVAGGHFDRTVTETVKIGIVNSTFDDLVAKDVEEPALLRDAYLNSDRARQEVEGVAEIRNIRRARWSEVVGFFWMWLLLSAFLLGIRGYAFYLFLGGTVSLYLQLRREVDGTDEEEIYPESETEAATGEEARWVGAPPKGDAPPAGDGGGAPA